MKHWRSGCGRTVSAAKEDGAAMANPSMASLLRRSRTMARGDACQDDAEGSQVHPRILTVRVDMDQASSPSLASEREVVQDVAGAVAAEDAAQ